MHYRCNYLNAQELYEFMLYKSMIACNIRINDGYMYSQKVDFFAPPKWILEILNSSRVEILGGDIYIYIYMAYFIARGFSPNETYKSWEPILSSK